MDINNIANSPVEFELSGKTYKVKRLSLLDLNASFEACVKQEYMKNISDYAQTITDVKEKQKFQTMAMKEMPQGRELAEMVSTNMNSIDGAIKILSLALNKCQQVSIEVVRDIIQDEKNSEVISTLMDFIIGNDVAKDEPEKKAIVPAL
jgi:bacterioferritin (cytochrome b1)